MTTHIFKSTQVLEIIKLLSPLAQVVIDGDNITIKLPHTYHVERTYRHSQPRILTFTSFKDDPKDAFMEYADFEVGEKIQLGYRESLSVKGNGQTFIVEGLHTLHANGEVTLR